MVWKFELTDSTINADKRIIRSIFNQFIGPKRRWQEPTISSLKKYRNWCVFFMQDSVICANLCLYNLGLLSTQLLPSVYYLTIRPTMHLETESEMNGDYKANSARGFHLHPVGATPPEQDTSGSSVLCIGHRGMGAEYAVAPNEERWPENTLLSFHRAAQIGLPMAELDVLPLRDSTELVIYHNFNVVTKPSGCDKQCGCPEYEIDLFHGKNLWLSFYQSIHRKIMFYFCLPNSSFQVWVL